MAESTPSESRSEAASARGSDVRFSCDGETVGGHLSLPPAERGRGVLVIPGASGLDPGLRDACDRLARAGFVAMGPDLPGAGKEPAPAAAGSVALDLSRAERVIDAAVTALLGRDAALGGRVAALGFGTGGFLALRAAGRSRRIGAVVDVCGVDCGVALDASALDAPVLGIFAAEDELVPAEAAAGLERELGAAGVRARCLVLPEVRHGFMDPGRVDRFDAKAARQAWDAVLAFLRAELS